MNLKNPNTMPAIQQRLTYAQREAKRNAEASGRRIAAQRAEQRQLARLEAERAMQPRNVFREILNQDDGRYGISSREGRIRRAQLEKRAAERDIEIEQELAAKAKAEKIANDPRVKNAIANAAYTLKIAEFQKWTDDELAEAQENAAIASEGEYAMYWERQSDLQKRVWGRESAMLAELATVKSAAIEQFELQRESVKQAQTLLDHSDISVTGPLDRQDNVG